MNNEKIGKTRNLSTSTSAKNFVWHLPGIVAKMQKKTLLKSDSCKKIRPFFVKERF